MNDIYACEVDVCVGEGGQKKRQCWCTEERTQLGKPTSLGSPMVPVNPGSNSATDFDWIRSLGENPSLKRASISPSVENGDHHHCPAELPQRFNENGCLQCMFSCRRISSILYLTASGFFFFFFFPDWNAIAYLRGSCKDSVRECKVSSKL